MAGPEQSPSVRDYNRGAEEFRRKNYDEAIRLFNHVVETDPKFHRGWAYLAMSYAASGRVDDAIEAYRKCIEIDGTYHKAYNNVGELYRRKGLLDYAAMVFKMATELDAGHAHYFYNLGITYVDIGMLPQAEEALARAHGMDPSDFDYASDLAQVRFNLKRYADAAAALEAFLQAAPMHSRETEVEARLKMLKRAASQSSASETPRHETTRQGPAESVS